MNHDTRVKPVMLTSRTDDPYDVANLEVSEQRKNSVIFLLILKVLLQDEYTTSWYLHLYCDRGQGPENTEFLPFFGTQCKIGLSLVLELARTLTSKREPISSTSRHQVLCTDYDGPISPCHIQVAIDGDSRWAHPSTDTYPRYV